GFGRRATCFFCFFVFSLSSLVMVENGTDKLERTHHVPVVGNCHGRHLVGGRRLDQVAYGNGRLQNGKLGMVVQVYKIHRSHIPFVGFQVLRGNGCSLLPLLPLAYLIGSGLEVAMRETNGRYRLWIAIAELDEIASVYLQFGRSEYLPFYQFEKTTGGSLHIGCCVMRFGKR